MNVNSILDLSKTIAVGLLVQYEQPWQAIPEIGNYISLLGAKLAREAFDQKGENIWIAKSATVADSACIQGPCIIDSGAEIRHCAFIRGNVVIGKNAIVGNSTELKNTILFDEVQVPHFNYIGDSILGYRAHFGAGAITSNVKSDKSTVVIKNNDDFTVDTGLDKLGAVVGDNVEVGCNAVLCPGAVIGRNSRIYPLCCVRGVLQENTIYKLNGIIANVK